ncbi:MAG: helix-turn-helix transcriptional regulator [Candidatus Sungbacteria bacterium]|uniref:Helix-turn-helix transcriptional regulator n=1 Tax=Candidatus Sungiibacteriota bacterium TaxID=2750080 RepID=A0A931WPB8_9BACT|nr:helix-turn-helix transcriptional regulator [Candidatus Sungbacteria bacterium]
MVESYTGDSRVLFSSGTQKKFLMAAKAELNISWKEFALIIGISERSLTDWKREKFLLPLKAVKRILKKTRVNLPQNIAIQKPFWSVVKAGKKGGAVSYRRYGIVGGNEAKRKKQWRKWWYKKGKILFAPYSTPLPVRQPKKSEELAELVGVLLGDGCITHYQVTVTLHRVDDRAYAKFVTKLMTNLFGVSPKWYEDKKDSVINITISRTALVKFCVNNMGLKIGNKIKQQVDIPNWIQKNKKFQIACVRGLVDTDGCLIQHAYRVGGKLYRYKKLAFTSYSRPLLRSVNRILKHHGLRPRIARERDIRLDSISDMKKYFEIFGSHNPKHLEKYLK